MIILESKINFYKYFKIFNIISILLVFFSVIILLFKGLNYGVDFKGGTLIELRVQDQTINISNIRQSFKKMNLGDVNIKKFGNKTDFLIKFEKKDEKNINFINDIKKKLALDIGLDDNQIILDPGIGFGKRVIDNDNIIMGIDKFKMFGFPVMIGVSRKSFLCVDDDSAEDRLPASLAVTALAVQNGADIIRTHDVEETYRMLSVTGRIHQANNEMACIS